LERYNRHIILSEIGEKGQQKLLASRVLVIGAGGLGCPVLQYLAGAGVGVLGVIDFDAVEESNLQRQILYGTSVLGKNKALAAKERLQDLNPTITINAYPEKLTAKNALALFLEYDIIVDGSDNFGTRYLVNDACIISGKPLVYGAIFKFHGQVSVFNYKNGPSYRCMFPTEPREGDVPSCNEIGVLGVLPGIIGSMQANEVLKIILELGTVLSGKILVYDSLSTEIFPITTERNDNIINEVLAQKDEFSSKQYEWECDFELAPRVINCHEAMAILNAQFVDVREPNEQPKVTEVSPIYVPMSIFSESFDSMDKDWPIILFCQSGIRSQKAASLLIAAGWEQVYSLREGAATLKTIQGTRITS